MKVLVTGGTGFIGRNLVVKLASLGHVVVCPVRNPGKASWMWSHSAITPVRADITSTASIARQMDGVEVAFHVAGLTRALSKKEYMRVNAEGTGNVACAAASNGELLKKIVYISSLSVAGPHCSELPAMEHEEPSPINAYGESKLRGETLLKEYMGEIPWLILRPPIVYGPFEKDLFTLFKMANRGFIPLTSSGDMELSLIHVDDLTDGIISAAFDEKIKNEIYYLSDGSVYRVWEMLQAMLSCAGGGKIYNVPPLVGKLAGYLGDIAGILTGRAMVVNSDKIEESLESGWVCSIEKAKRELGFQPQIFMEKGFERTYSWYRDAGWL